MILELDKYVDKFILKKLDGMFHGKYHYYSINGYILDNFYVRKWGFYGDNKYYL